jgi:hypothetical protein
MITMEFDEMGGYDCMSDAFNIKRDAKIIVQVDLADFGQSGCRPHTTDQYAAAERVARVCFEALKKELE